MNDFVFTYKTKEDQNDVLNAVLNKWHRFGLISKFEFDEFMKNCTNPEQVVYW